MGAIRRIAMFGGGGLLGLAAGVAAAYLAAPRSGDELKRQVKTRLQEAKLAGIEADRTKQEELIQRFRSGVGDPGALEDVREQTRVEASQAAAAIGLGLNAPGALVAHEVGRRMTESHAMTTPNPSVPPSDAAGTADTASAAAAGQPSTKG